MTTRKSKSGCYQQYGDVCNIIDLKLFQNMKSEYFKNFIVLRQHNRDAYQSYLDRIQLRFQELQQHHHTTACLRFESELQAAKDFRQLKHKDKQSIYKYFVDRNIADFVFLRENNLIDLRIMKATKTHLEDYQLNWQQVWQRLLANEPEIPTLKLYSELIDFLKNVRHLYDPNNAVQVVNYFVGRHSLYADNLSLYISLFANITHKTKGEVLKEYLQKLIELYHLNMIKASNLLIMYINASKHKKHEISQTLHQQLNKIVLYSLATPASEKKESIQSKFNTQTASIIVKIIGKCNVQSVNLLQQILQVVKNYIRPFEDSKKPLKFLYLLISGIVKRLEVEEGYRKKIVKLREKEEKRIKKQQKEEEKNKQIVNSAEAEDSAVTVTTKEESANEPPAEGVAKQEKPGENEEAEEESDEDEEENNDDSEEQNEGKIENIVGGMELQVEEGPHEKSSSIISKIEKLQCHLKNQITTEVQELLKKFVATHFQEIFYVNSKKIVNRTLRESFKLFPELIDRAFEALDKAANIPQINEEGLISNIKQMAKYLFKQPINYTVLLDNVLKLLSRIVQNRRITDVWEIINVFVQKIPLLDEQDYGKIDDKQKEAFEQKFGTSHDRFYQTYSEMVFQCLKRVFEESEHYDLHTSSPMDKNILDLLSNCYPCYKSRVVHEIEDQILENNNKFLLTILHSGLKPSKNFQASLHELIENLSIQSEENLQLEISVNLILSIDMQIEQIKKLIRRYSKKNNYKFLRQCMINLTNYNLTLQPLTTNLEYLETKPTFALVQEPPFELVKNKMKPVAEYVYEIIGELHEQLRQFEEQPLRKLSYPEIVAQVYSSAQSNFKNKKVEKRKLVNELLQILRIILENLLHELEEYNPTTNTVEYLQAPYVRQSLLTNQKFLSILDRLVYNQIFLHDPSIMDNLSVIVENEAHFMYRHQIRMEKDILKKYNKRSSREELPGQSHLNEVVNVFITKARLAHFSILYNKYKESVNIETITDQLKVLIVAPGNEKSNSLSKLMVKKTTSMNQQAERIIELLGYGFNSRFYYEKVFGLLSDFSTSNYQFTEQQILNVINAHVPLIQSETLKIREQSLKSLEKFLKIMHKGALLGNVEKKLRQFTTKDKFEIIWIIAILIILKEAKRSTSTEYYLTTIKEYMLELEKLILSEARIVRRLALFAYSFCLRKVKLAVTSFSTCTTDSPKYPQPKTIHQIFESGYIRPEQQSLEGLANRHMLKKTAPYTVYRVKVIEQSEIYSDIKNSAFNFLLQNPQLGVKVMSQFHIDMAASIEQVVSMVQNKKNDLGEIAIRTLEGCYIYNKLHKLHFDKFEFSFGERFFRYLFSADASKNQFAFFRSTNKEVETMLVHLENYDNQTIIFIYLLDLLAAYQKSEGKLSEQIRTEVQQFVIKVISEMIYKGSGTIFKKLMVLVSNIKHKEGLKFVWTYLEGLIKSKEKIARATQLFFTIHDDDYHKYLEVLEFILANRLEINNPFIHVLVNSIITLPEKYLITRQHVKENGIIDPEAELTSGRMQKMRDFYLLSIEPFNQLLKKSLQGYLADINEATSAEAVKEKTELIKATYGIAASAISAYTQSYQTAESIQSTVCLLQIIFKLFESKLDLELDFKQLEETIKNLISNKYDSIANFWRVIEVIMKHLTNLPVKKQADVIKIITNRPGNFLFLGKDNYKQFLLKLLEFEENSMIYREVMAGLSTILAYVSLTVEEIEELLGKASKAEGVLLMQGYVLSTLDIGCSYVERILSVSAKDRRNLFCKEILTLRGKREYLDDEASYKQWKEIKQYSNPYHYHA